MKRHMIHSSAVIASNLLITDEMMVSLSFLFPSPFVLLFALYLLFEPLIGSLDCAERVLMCRGD